MQENAETLKQIVVDALEALKAVDVRVLDVHGVSDVTDVMIIASGNSNRQVKALAENVIEKAKEKQYRPLGVEGLEAGEWALVDLGDVVVHVMLPRVRDFYQLERLWTAAEETEAVPKQRGR